MDEVFAYISKRLYGRLCFHTRHALAYDCCCTANECKLACMLHVRLHKQILTFRSMGSAHNTQEDSTET